MADVNEQQAARERNGLPPTGASATVLADAFNRKVESHLGDRVILKPLTRWNEARRNSRATSWSILSVVMLTRQIRLPVNARSTKSSPNTTPRVPKKS